MTRTTSRTSRTRCGASADTNNAANGRRMPASRPAASSTRPRSANNKKATPTLVTAPRPASAKTKSPASRKRPATRTYRSMRRHRRRTATVRRTASSDASTNVARASTRTAASRGATPKNASRSSTTRRTDRYDANAVGASTMRARKSTATASPRATTDKARAGGTHAGRDTASSREGDDGTCHALGGGRVGSRSVPRKPGGNVKCCRVKGRSFWSATNI